MKRMQIHPSILTANLACLAQEIARVPSADAIHIDVMDNHFVPNLSMGRPVVESVRRITDKPLDLHLMIENADHWAPQYAEMGAQIVTFHVEAAEAPVRLARQLRALGVRASMALKPGTAIEPYADMLKELDQVLVMTVEPGFGGQELLESTLPKITRVKALARARGVELAIQVDGGITMDTIGRCAEAGADVFVAGAAVFSASDPDAVIQALRQAVEQH